ncbi:MAG: hypothetical protein AAGF11_10275 [Myxococcota bacterium]
MKDHPGSNAGRCLPCHLRALSQLTAIAVVVAACQEGDTRSVVEIGQLAVVNSDEPLCGGDIHRIEQAFAHIQDVLDVSVHEPIPVFVYDRISDYERSIEGRCRSGSSGCFSNGEVHTLWQSLEHELVHAVARPAGFPAVFWDEGIAEALSDRNERGEADIMSSLELPPGELPSYRTAGHFVRWLLEEYGPEGIRRIAREEAFSQAYGFELSDAIDDYEANAPWSYPHWNPCSGELLSSTGPDTWVVDIEINCADRSATVEYSLGVGAMRTIDIEQGGVYRLALHGGRGLNIVACQLEVLDSPPASDFAGDIIREDAGLKPPSQFVSDEEHLVELEPGRLLMYLSTEEGITEGQLSLELERLGP